MSDRSSPDDGPRRSRSAGDRVLRALRSARLALYLLLGVALLAIPGTLFSPAEANRFLRTHVDPALLPAARAIGLVDPYHSPLFATLLVLLCAGIATCTVHRLRRRSSPRPDPVGQNGRLRVWADALTHLSLIVILAGGAAKGFWGFTATEYLLPGKPQRTAFDVRTETDVPLGFTLLLREIEETYYPIRARIGVTAAPSGEKIALVELAEGRRTEEPLSGLTLSLERYDPQSETLAVAVERGGQRQSFSLETRPGGTASAEFAGHGLTLVAYTRELRNVRGLVTITEAGSPDVTAWISPTDRIAHRGTNLYQTAWGVHPEQGPYIGLQVSRDPFAALFWGGCALLGLALPLFVIARLRRAGRNTPADSSAN